MPLSLTSTVYKLRMLDEMIISAFKVTRSPMLGHSYPPPRSLGFSLHLLSLPLTPSLPLSNAAGLAQGVARTTSVYRLWWVLGVLSQHRDWNDPWQGKTMDSEPASAKSPRESMSFWIIKLRKRWPFRSWNRQIDCSSIWEYWTPLWDLLPNPPTGLLDYFQPRIQVSLASLRTTLGFLITVQRNEHLIGMSTMMQSESAAEPGNCPSQLCHVPAVWALADDRTFVVIIFLIYTLENNTYFLGLLWIICDTVSPKCLCNNHMR